MTSQPRKGTGSSLFRGLGKFVYRRRKVIVVAWIIALIAVLPVISNEGKVTSLQLGTATGSGLESVQASNLISAEFAKTVPNSSLIIVVTGPNVSSPATQGFVTSLASSLQADKGIRGLNETLDVYTRLYTAIGGANRAAYASLSGANATSQLLLGVPALYFGAWQQAYSSTHSVAMADAAAYNATASTLSAANSTAYSNYSSHVLSLFNSTWAGSWSDQALANSTLLARATIAAQAADGQYLDQYAPASRSLAVPLLQAYNLTAFVTDTRAQSAATLTSFATGYAAQATGFSDAFVTSAFSLGKTYDNSSLYRLAGNMVWSPSKYGVGHQLSTLISSLVSPSRSTTLVALSLSVSENQNIVEVRSVVSNALSASGAASGVKSAQVTGEDAISYDFGNSTQADLALILPVTIILLIAATGLFFRSLLTPFVTLGTIGVALGISQVFIVLVGLFVAKIDFTVPTILLTILIGVGTDYSVFVIARYREERVKGASVEDAIGTSVTWAGESIATSGATVIISFLSLAVTSVVFLKTMGYVVGLGVLVALLVALTLVPAAVSMLGGRVFWPTSGRRFERYASSALGRLQGRKGYFSRSGSFAVKRAKVLIVLAMVVSIPAVYIYVNTTPTFDFISAAPSNLPSIAASNQLTASFGGGKLLPTYVVVTFAQPVVTGHAFNGGEMGTIAAMTATVASSRDVQNVTSPTSPYGQPVNYSSLDLGTAGGRQTFNAIMQSIGSDNKTVLITANYGIDPYSTAAISDAQALRQQIHASYDGAANVTGVFLGGASGSILDTKNFFDSQFGTIVPIVAVGVALVLLVVLGSLFLPVFAVVSVLMSIVWTLAATRLVFEQLYNYQMLFLIPFFLFVALLGLGMDYNVFILTRVREEATKGKRLDEAIVSAMEQTGGIITAAAVILAGSLGALMLSSDLLLKEIGFAFAYSILIDALIVRTYMVPAVMSVMGKWNWYNPIPYLKRSRALYEADKDAGGRS
ncbi:MAG: MMPL family transporter [Nitrososphaerota archaeon]|nr:MMPL family transporter [Nitrososphaerota archaeon]